jgi:hypothetical protein
MPQSAACRRWHREQRKLYNTAHKPRSIVVVDAQCADPYRITRVDYEIHKADYLKTPGIRVFIDGEEQGLQLDLI